MSIKQDKGVGSYSSVVPKDLSKWEQSWFVMVAMVLVFERDGRNARHA